MKLASGDRMGTKRGELAIKKPEFKKIEAEIVGGIARIQQRVALVSVLLVMDYDLQGVELDRGDEIILRGDAGLQPWANHEFRLPNSEDFVLCPESQVVGYIRRAKVGLSERPPALPPSSNGM